MDLTQSQQAKNEYEWAEEQYNEQKYICDSLRTAIEAIQNLEWSEARDEIEYELESELTAANSALLCCEAALDAADASLRRLELDSTYDRIT